jgi:hypothetical protein
MTRFCSVLLFALTIQGSGAEKARSPENLGAHPAILSEESVLELITDDLRSVASGRRSEGVARNHFSGGARVASVLAQARQDRTGNATYAKGLERREDSATLILGTEGTLQFRRMGSSWKVTGGSMVVPGQASGSLVAEVPPVGSSFIPTAISVEHGIDRLSRGATIGMLGKALMSTTGKTASYYRVRYFSSAPFVSATYLQFVVDREWNRILYGNLDHWIKAYTAVLGPASIATDASGRVFVSETGNQRISVLQIAGEGAETHLMPVYTIMGLAEPGDIALNDNGTPLDVTDDALYVIERSRNEVLKFAVGQSSAALIASFDGFDTPSSLLAGKWNGAGNGLLYVIDGTGRHVQLLEDGGSSVTHIRDMWGTYRQYFQDMKVDHFGNVYLVDNVNARILKYTADLEFLDETGGADMLDSPGAIDIPYGKIEIEGKGTYWAGFDQLFTAERWTEHTGAARSTLGVALRNIRFLADPSVSTVSASFVLTDFGDVAARIYDSADRLVRTIQTGWMVSGQKTLAWNRRDDKGHQVAPDTYRFEIEAVSGYRDEPVVSRTQFYLPLYYWQDCGSMNVTDDALLAQGSAVAWGPGPSQTASEHASSVQYRFTGLNPESEYEVSSEYVSHDGVPRSQELTADGSPLHPAVPVSSTPVNTGFLALPRSAYEDGEVTLAVNRRGEGAAIVSQIWFRETGVGFTAGQVLETTPRSYTLEQNYPNPFNPSTVIRYSVPVEGHVTLTVYDITGREISTLVNTQQTAGTHEVKFDARTSSGGVLASGVYFYRVRAGKFTETKKMILLK